MASLQLKNIKKTYGNGITAVNDFNLDIEDQEFVIFVGPSGCGKSTTLRMIAGLEEISDGELYIGGKLMNDVASKDRDIAMVFQNYALYPHMTVYDNMAFGLKLRKVPKEEIDKIANDRGAEPENCLNFHYTDLVGFFSDEHMIMNPESEPDSASYSQMKYIRIIPIEDYNRLMGKNETPAPGECIIYPIGIDYDYGSIDIKEYGKLTVKKKADDFIADQESSVAVVGSLYIFTPDYSSLSKKLGKYIYESTNTQMAEPHIYYGFDLDCRQDEQIQIYRNLFNHLEKTDINFSLESRAQEAEDFFSVFGSLFILGVLLGIVFIVAMILIMYYKQVSEGYEDKERLAIMQKVGMTKKEIRQSVNSQVLTVFFLPLVTAGIHLLFSFHMVSKLLKLFNLQDVRLLMIITLCCYLVFALFYVIVYYITSHSYYRLVSGAKK